MPDRSSASGLSGVRGAPPDSQAGGLLPPLFLATVAFVGAVATALIALLGPLVLGVIRYPTSASGLWQTEGLDLVNLVLVTPLLVAGGVLHARGKPAGRFLLVLPALALIYNGLGYGVGQEWGNPSYTGNSYQFAPLFLALIVAGLFLLVGGLSLFRASDAPTLEPRAVRRFAAVFVPFLLVFAALWVIQVVQVMETGGLPDGSYAQSPTSFWLVRYLDLGVTIPLGLLTVYLLLTGAGRAYGLTVAFAGYFVTLGTSVAAMGGVMAFHHDASVAGGNAIQLVVFGVLAVLSWWVLLFLLQPKFHLRSLLSARKRRGMGVSEHAPAR
jgi:hypothetical protein